MHFFGCYERKALRKVEAHLVAKNADGTRTGAVGFAGTLVQNMSEKVVVLLHGIYLMKNGQ